VARNRNFDYEALLEEERLILAATEAIHRLMGDEGVNRTELARRIGASKGHITQLLDGSRNMTLRTLSRMLRAVGHRAIIETEPLSHRASSPKPLQTHKIHGYICLTRAQNDAEMAERLDTIRATHRSVLLSPETSFDIDEEFTELLAGAA